MWGGKREGTGRKKDPKKGVYTSLSLYSSTKELLRPIEGETYDEKILTLLKNQKKD
jgi:hypothetical protein